MLPEATVHGAGLVVIDQPALPLGHLRRQRLGHHAVEVNGIGFNGSSERPATKRAEADAAWLGRLAGTQRHAIVVEHQQCAVAHDGRAHGSEIERHHVELLAGDVTPHVLLGPIGEREDARRLAGP